MRVRCRWLAKLFFVAIGSVVCDLAPGQLLSFDRTAPTADTMTATSELATYLLRQAEAIEGMNEVSAGMQASAAVRRVAGAMLRSGEAMGDAGSVRCVIARTLVGALTEFDEFFACDEAGLTGPMLRMMAGDLNALAGSIPVADDRLERGLRDAFVPLTNALGRIESAWPVSGLGYEEFPSLDEADAALLEPLTVALERARGYSSHAASAERTQALLVRGAGVLTVPGWVREDARAVLREQFREAVDWCLDPADAERGVDALEHLGRVSLVLSGFDGMRAGASRRVATERVSGVIVDSAGDRLRSRRVISAAWTVLEAYGDDAVLEHEGELPTQLRVAWRAGVEDFEGSRARVLSALVELLDRADPLAEPAMLSAMRAHRENREFLEQLVSFAKVSGVRSVPSVRPRLRGEFGRVGARAIELGRDMSRAGAERERSRAVLQVVAQAVSLGVPSEAELRLREAVESGSDGWARVCGGVEGQLVERVDVARGAMMEVLLSGSWDELVERYELLRVLLEKVGILDAMVRVLEGDQHVLECWGAWSASEHAWGALVERLERAGVETARRLVAGEEFEVVELGATAIAVAGLMEIAKKVRVIEGGAVAAAIGRVALGPPHRDAVLVNQRVNVGLICVRLEELASSRLRGEEARAESLEQALERASREVVHALKRTRD